MKGIVFTEFLEMVALRFGENLVDDIIADAHLPHGGAYTSVGTYPHSEMVSLISSMSERTKLSMDTLLETFGCYLFGRFYQRYPQFMDATNDPLEFLMGIETIVHREVKKLYPDAQLPHFDTQRISTHEIAMDYRSAHDFSSLALGLINGCADHYRCKLSVSRSSAVRSSQGVSVNFGVKRLG